jgi:hypothetical protein
MKKIPSLFKRNYDGDRLVRDEVVEGCEWVIAGEGVATEKWDGTACMIKGGKLFKRYDAKARKKKPIPKGFIPCQDEDMKTGHWPGWVPVGNGPEDKWHREAFENLTTSANPMRMMPKPEDGTYELVGPKVQGNPHGLKAHELRKHGTATVWATHEGVHRPPPRDFHGLREFFRWHDRSEGIVWHHPDGRMCKIKRRDFGLPWPPEEKHAN